MTPSEKALIADMADVLLWQETDLGDERVVEVALYCKGYRAADIDKYIHAAIDLARALRVMADGEFATVTLGG